MRGTWTFLALAFLLGWAGHGSGRKLEVPKLLISQTPLAQKAIPFSVALGELGERVQNGYVLFGVEIRTIGDDKEPTVDLNVADGDTLGDALRDLLRQVPGYTLEVVSEHLINIYPTGAKEDPNDPHNLLVEEFDVVNEPPDVILSCPELYIPNLPERLAERTLGPRYPIRLPSQWSQSVGPPPVTLHLRNVTVLEILNAVSEASENRPSKYSPLGWVALFHPDPAWAVGGTYSWQARGGVPEDWKQHAVKTTK